MLIIYIMEELKNLKYNDEKTNEMIEKLIKLNEDINIYSKKFNRKTDNEIKELYETTDEVRQDLFNNYLSKLTAIRQYYFKLITTKTEEERKARDLIQKFYKNRYDNITKKKNYLEKKYKTSTNTKEKEELLKQRKEDYIKKKDELNKKSKEYYEKNQDNINNKMKDYYKEKYKSVIESKLKVETDEEEKLRKEKNRKAVKNSYEKKKKQKQEQNKITINKLDHTQEEDNEEEINEEINEEQNEDIKTIAKKLNKDEKKDEEITNKFIEEKTNKQKIASIKEDKNNEVFQKIMNKEIYKKFKLSKIEEDIEQYIKLKEIKTKNKSEEQKREQKNTIRRINRNIKNIKDVDIRKYYIDIYKTL